MCISVFCDCEKTWPRLEPVTLIGRFVSMSREAKESLERQAERAESIAEQTVDESLKDILQQAAKEYRDKAAREDN